MRPIYNRPASSPVLRSLQLAALIVATIGGASVAHAQISRAALEALAAPSSPQWNWSMPASVDWSTYVAYPTTFSRTYHNYAKNMAADANNPSNLQYAELEQNPNQIVSIVPYFSQPVAAPVFTDGEWRDNCYHAHFAYAFWRRPAVWSSGKWNIYWQFVASEGQIGRRLTFTSGTKEVLPGETGYATAGCYVNSDTPRYANSAAFAWKNNSSALTSYKFAVSSTIDLTYAYVAMQGASHGWGDCGQFQCYPDVTLFLVPFSN